MWAGSCPRPPASFTNGDTNWSTRSDIRSWFLTNLTTRVTASA